jgi:hypothetical protein
MPPRSADLPALPPAEFASSEPAGQVRAWDDQRGVPEQPELAPAGDRARAAETTLPGRHHGGIRPVSTVSYPSWATTPDLFGQSGASRPREGQSPASQPVPTATPVGDGNELAVRPNGPRAEPDGSWTWGSARLNPDQVRIADDMHGRLHAAEGRTAHDGYGNGGLTAKLRRIEAGLEHGRLAPDRGQRALIDPDIFKAELAGLIRRHPGVPAEELARHITGALSYTFVFDPAHYSAGIWLVHDVLRAQGFWLEARRNGWAGTGPKGVVSSWLDPSFDVAFQVQFHTAASFAAQQLARTSANAIRDPRTPPAEAARLKSDLASTWATVASPVGTTEIGDYRRATR